MHGMAWFLYTVFCFLLKEYSMQQSVVFGYTVHITHCNALYIVHACLKLEECRLHGVRKLAVNANVRG